MSSTAPSSPASHSHALVAVSIKNAQQHSPARPTPQLELQDIPEQWEPILHAASNQVVLYNPHSHALSITTATRDSFYTAPVPANRRHRKCPYCKQSLPPDFGRDDDEQHFNRLHEDPDEVSDSDSDHWKEAYELPSLDPEGDQDIETLSRDPAYYSRASDYFQLLAIANERSLSQAASEDGASDGTGMANQSVPQPSSDGQAQDRSQTFPAEKMAEGYFKSFFQEEYKLGMGANGSVYLCQHVLDGNSLGHFAVKKIAVGESHSYLLNILREVRLLERLRHPNIITYHHAWLESAQFSSFGPTVPTLHVLMQWAEGGSLDDFIDVRLGRKPAHVHMHPYLYATSQSPPVGGIAEETPSPGAERSPALAAAHSPSTPADLHSRSARIRAFRAYQRAPPEEKEKMKKQMDAVFGETSSSRGKEEWTAVHLLSADEVKSLFKDVVEGLAFLHDRSILHLDLKPGNVLLTWDEGNLIPRAMLSDFGTSRDMVMDTSKLRSGNTGTLEYAAPESLRSPITGTLQQVDSKADMWSLGMILHKLLFFKLPYRYAAVGDANGQPVSTDREDEKMQRLEAEILHYPGFKTNAETVVTFERRRLPKSFLVLLENLLHRAPGTRPSCARVTTAIREGKFDPLTQSSSNSPNLPLAPRAPGMSNSSVPVTPLQNGGVKTDFPRERLALPSTIEIFGPAEGSWTNWTSFVGWSRWGQSQVGWLKRSLGISTTIPPSIRPRSLSTATKRGRRDRRSDWLMRVLRSGVLVAKVMTLPALCRSAGSSGTFVFGLRRRPRGSVVALLLGLGVADTVVDYESLVGFRRGLVLSALLAAFHAGVTYYVSPRDSFWSRVVCIDV